MKTRTLLSALLIAAGTLKVHAQQRPPAIDTSLHKIQFIQVEPNVKLEVLDWGGTGRPLVFLAGAGNDVHVFDNFAPKFVPRYHVYGITRRGFGASSHPAFVQANYTADRLGSDVLAVLLALKLNRPVLVGHSLAGEEMSWIGSHHPDQVAGLIYLEAGYAFAFYSSALGDGTLDGVELRNELDAYLAGGSMTGNDLSRLKADVARFGGDLVAQERRLATLPPLPPNFSVPPSYVAISSGGEKFTTIHDPVLAIYADPHDPGPRFGGNAEAREAFIANDRQETTRTADAFQAGVPQARVVRIANADHYIFLSNEAQVIHEMNSFLAALPR